MSDPSNEPATTSENGSAATVAVDEPVPPSGTPAMPPMPPMPHPPMPSMFPVPDDPRNGQLRPRQRAVPRIVHVVDKPTLVKVLKYLDECPHGEVRDMIDRLMDAMSNPVEMAR